MATESDLDTLRAELRPVNVGYVRANHPDAVRLAETYNRQRTAVDPDDPRRSRPHVVRSRD
jgi:hypothetical protein